MTDYRNRHRTRADITLGHRLAALRVARGLTQGAAAEFLTNETGARWTQVTVSNIERGRTPCTVSQYVQMSWLYGMDVSTLPIDRTEAAEPCEVLPDDLMPRPRVKP